MRTPMYVLLILSATHTRHIKWITTFHSCTHWMMFAETKHGTQYVAELVKIQTN